MKRTLVKICGMTRAEDARLCAALGADMLGFIFHRGSPRNVDPAFPASLNGRADLLGALKVGVFVGQSASEVRDIMQAGGLDLAQLHDGQDEAFCQQVGAARVIKVLWPEKAESTEALQAEIDRFAPHCRLFLADAGSGGGGHGRTIESDRLAAARFPNPWLLAGGLTPENAADMLRRYTPSGLDINSGVESAPGIKDATKLRAALYAIRAAKL